MKTLSRFVLLPRHVVASTIFLSRLPLWRLFPQNEQDFRFSAQAFPIAGWFIAAIPLALGFGLYALGLPGPLSALVLLAAMAATTGALHEDGLADVVDGFWGGHTPARKLEIMRDSAVGTYGVLALFFVTIGRFLTIVYLFDLPLIWAAPAYGAVASLSRFAILIPWAFLPPARSATDMSGGDKPAAGLSARFGRPDRLSLLMGAVWAVPAFATLAWLNPLSLLFGALALFAIMLMAKQHIGGQTGDVLGATQQLVELGLLFGLCIAMSGP